MFLPGLFPIGDPGLTGILNVSRSLAVCFAICRSRHAQSTAERSDFSTISPERAPIGCPLFKGAVECERFG